MIKIPLPYGKVFIWIHENANCAALDLQEWDAMTKGLETYRVIMSIAEMGEELEKRGLSNDEKGRTIVLEAKAKILGIVAEEG